MLIQSWSDYYPSISYKEKFESNFTNDERLAPSKGNTYIYNCIFLDMFTKNNGASIFYSLNAGNILVEKNSFYNCSSTGYTGAIRVLTGNSIITHTCGYQCEAGVNDAFSAIGGSDTVREENFIFDSSISRCKANKSFIMYHQYGHVQVKSINSSHNFANSSVSIACYAGKYDIDTHFYTKMSYCSFLNNTADSQYSIQISGKSEIRTTNVIKNQVKDTVFSRGNLEIIQSSFLDNADPCFSTSSDDSHIFLYNCSTSFASSEDQSFSHIEQEIKHSFIVALHFYETGPCYNLFLYITPTTHKCFRSQNNHFILSKIFLNSIFIFLISI